MSFVGEPFLHDLFVSYSHGDPTGAGNALLEQWSVAYVEQLTLELQMNPEIGAAVQVYLDRSARPGQGVDPMLALTKQLRDDVGSAALLHVLMTPHYLKSDWCQHELDWWRTAQERWGLSPEGRIAVARLMETPAAWPPALVDERGQPLVGYDFENDGRDRPTPWPCPDSKSGGKFRDSLIKLVGNLTLKLGELRRQVEERRRRTEADGRLATPGGQVLYLHARRDVGQDQAWQQTKDALAANGFVVLPSEPDPVEGDPAARRRVQNTRVETLSGCDALLLLASADGRSVDADMVVVGRSDRQAARSTSDGLLPCALLDTVGPTLAIANRVDTARRLGIDWLDCVGTPAPAQVEAWLHRVGSDPEARR